MLALMLTGCVTTPSETAVLERLAPLAAQHAAALAGDDISKMRETGRNLIATYEAGAN